MSKSLTDTIRKIEALITKADHPNTGEAEAATFRAKAEALMFKYRIDEMSLNTSGEASAPDSASPQWETFVVCDMWSEFRYYYEDLLRGVIQHFDARMATGNEDGNRVAYVVGYESDLRFIGILWQSIRLAFRSKLEPTYDPTLSDEENCYIMRAAGMEGARIAYAVFQDASKGQRVKARKYARKFAESIGEDPKIFSGQGNSMEAYRASYASGFVSTMRSRLRTMAEGRLVENAGAMVLASRKENIDEAFYTRYPDRRPKPQVESAVPSSWDEQKNCPKCQKAKSGYCREHGWMKPTRGRYRTVRANSGAMAAGASAARSVQMGGDRKLGN